MRASTSIWRSLAPALLLAVSIAHAQDTLRPEVGKPLQAAQELMRAGKYKEALGKVREADAVPDRTPFEKFILDRMRGSAAASAGEDETASKSFEAALASGRLQPAERLQVFEALASTAYRAKEYAKSADWAARYFQEGGSDSQLRNLQVNAHYLGGDFAGVVRDLEQKVQAAEQAIPAIDEQTLRLLASSYSQLGDDNGYVSTLEKLVLHHPKKEYWADLLARVPRKTGFADRLALDVHRLQFATDTLNDTAQYVEMVQLCLQAGLPGEAKKVVDAGYGAGKLGVGAEAERHRRLRDLTVKQVAEDERSLNADVIGRNADALVATGNALVASGRVDKGIELFELAISKGGLKRPEDARLHLGLAYLNAGNKPKAVATFKSVKGNDGTTDLARLWTIYAARL